jgi:hypothetical protein
MDWDGWECPISLFPLRENTRIRQHIDRYASQTYHNLVFTLSEKENKSIYQW